MSLTSILSAEAIDKALKECQAPESFDHKKFFQSCGLSSKTAQEVKEVFRILDDDNSGYIEEAEFKFFLQRFKPDARILTDKEAKSLISAADNDSDGKIGAEGQCLKISNFTFGYCLNFPFFFFFLDSELLIGQVQSQWVEPKNHRFIDSVPLD
uniref:Parvalbumin n=1 Tax=Myripristis murdjan TaxID=586833 RepID=A0A668AUI2_9TELE